MLSAMASWANHLSANDDYYRNAKPLPLTPKNVPTIAQLALPSPDDSSSPSGSSNTSHEHYDHDRFDHPTPRRPNRLRKAPPSSYPFSFIPEDPAPIANFPYTFHRSTPSSPTSSFVAAPARAMSIHTPARPLRKLTKRRPSDPPPTAAADLSMARIAERPPLPPLPPMPPMPPPLLRRSTFTLNLRRKKSTAKISQSDHGHDTLPALPPPSPLVLNMPTFRPFHARRRDSWHLSEQPVARHSSPATTAAFDDLAWTGVTPRDLGTTVMRGTRGGWKSTWSLALPPDPPPLPRAKPIFTLGTDEPESESPRSESPVAFARPPLLRRHAVTASPKRRWTLAMALTDEGISDEALVEKLEALRSRSRVGSFATDCPPETDEWDQVWAAYDDEPDEPEPLPHPPPRTASLPALPSPTWQSARRALLTCRELVRTERHYLASLHALLAGRTRGPPPPLMLAYANALARESEALLARMEEDPSAWGVAAAFLGAEEGAEAALVAWCGVVGGWFSDAAVSTGRRRLSKLRTGSEGGEEEEKRAGGWRVRRLSGGLSSRAPSVESVQAHAHAHGLPAVRDLAILPTQRVMRYVLLYRDLLAHTPPSSPARALVERTVEAAVRIAQRCDRAQGNAAFLQRG